MIHTILRPKIIVLLLALAILSTVDSSQQVHEYTFAEIIRAYETGHFRIIQTNSFAIYLSSNGEYAYAFEDGVYRISDGKYYPELDDAEFSPDGNYVAQNGHSVFELASEKWVLNSETTVTFSDNSEYVGVAEDGVYRLADVQKILATHSLEIQFSPDSHMVALADGIYLLPSGEKLLTTTNLATFSPDSQYAWTRTDGLYRLNDQQKLFDITTPYNVSFTPDMKYVTVLGDGVYDLDTGELAFSMSNNVELAYANPKYSPCGRHILVDGDGLYRISDGKKLLNHTNVTFSPSCTYIEITHDGIYRIDNMEKVFDVTDNNGSQFSNDEEFVAIYGVGTYHTSNWRKVFDEGSYPTFSPDTTYIAFDWGGVYRMHDEQRLFKIDGQVAGFSTEEDYLIVEFIEDDGIYHLATGRHYPGLQILDVSTGVMSFGNTILIVDLTIDEQSYLFGSIKNNGSFLYEQPVTTSDTLQYINNGIPMGILEENDGWYKVGYGGEVGWVPAESVTTFSVPE